MDVDVRPITDAEVADWLDAVRRGFLHAHPDPAADLEMRRPGIDVRRTLAGFDGGAIVSTLRSFATELTVPGGATVPTDAVTAVTTTSTHRRRGLATAMVTRDLRESAERGEQAAVLIAAEWGIYGRFGYGAATEHQTLTLHTKGARPRHQPVGSVEFVDRDTARALAPAVYERHRANQPGELAWDARAWDIDFGVIPSASGDDKPSFHVIARDASGEPDRLRPLPPRREVGSTSGGRSGAGRRLRRQHRRRPVAAVEAPDRPRPRIDGRRRRPLPRRPAAVAAPGPPRRSGVGARRLRVGADHRCARAARRTLVRGCPGSW